MACCGLGREADFSKDCCHGNVCFACSSGCTDQQVDIAVGCSLIDFALYPIQCPVKKTRTLVAMIHCSSLLANVQSHTHLLCSLSLLSFRLISDSDQVSNK